MTSPLNLTFGIELEFVLLGKIAEGTGYSSDEALLPDEDDVAFPIELKSRVFEFHTEQNWRAEIASVLRTLHHHFNRPESAFRIFVPSTCGFHVHIGNRRDAFPFGTIQRLMQLVTAHERRFDTLHAAERIYTGYGGGEMSPSNYCTPPSEVFCHQAEHLAWLDQQTLDKGKLNSSTSWEAVDADPDCESCTDKSTNELNRYDGEDGTNSAPSNGIDSLSDDDVGSEECPCGEDPVATETQPLLPKEEEHRLTRSKSPTAWITRIQNARTLKELAHMTDTRYHCAAYNIENLFEVHSRSSSICSSPVGMQPDTISALDEYNLGSCEPTLTIEFRQHQGSLDEQEIMAWIDVVAFLTEWAHHVGFEQLSRVLSAAQIMDRKLDVLDLLKQLGGFHASGCPRNLPNCVLNYYHQRRAPDTIKREFERAMSRIDLNSSFYNLVLNTEESRREQRAYATVLSKVEEKTKIGLYGDIPQSGLDTSDSESNKGVRGLSSIAMDYLRQLLGMEMRV
ncbi:MAG: hypothetical protein Q9165_007341 [Trypethelium subeluteriae]